MKVTNANAHRRSRYFAIRISNLDSIRGLMRGRILYGDSRDVEWPRNFQNMSRLDGADLAAPITGRLYREIGISPKTDRAFDECRFSPRFQSQPSQNDAAIAQRKRSFS